MNRLTSVAIRRAQAAPPVWICLALALLFLYNPFFVLRSSSEFPNVQRTPSYRSTIASSELQSSRLTPARPQVEIFDEAAVERTALAPATTAPAARRTREIEAPPPQLILVFSSLWFRPPPSL
jgi:hypothetical protein